MKDRGLKTRTPISSTLKNELYDRLKSLSEQSQVPMSKLLDNAVTMLLAEREPKTTEKPPQ